MFPPWFLQKNPGLYILRFWKIIMSTVLYNRGGWNLQLMMYFLLEEFFADSKLWGSHISPFPWEKSLRDIEGNSHTHIGISESVALGFDMIGLERLNFPSLPFYIICLLVREPKKHQQRCEMRRGSRRLRSKILRFCEVWNAKHHELPALNMPTKLCSNSIGSVIIGESFEVSFTST